jgi:hypothetical protein
MRNGSFLKPYLQPAFLICIGILAAWAAGLPIIEHIFGLYLKKEPIPLKKSLDSLDEIGLGHYKVKKLKIQSEDVINTLGTQNYIQWLLEDTNSPADSPVRYCMLFITYYDLPDIVPHVPEECYIGGGNEKLNSEGMNLPVQGEDFHKTIPVQCLVFGATEGQFLAEVKFPIFYLFNTDGVYTNSREETRVVLNKNIFSKYSYFSKVEWKFFNSNQFSATVYPDKDEAVKASKRLLAVILPKLEKEHWPDWEKLKRE